MKQIIVLAREVDGEDIPHTDHDVQEAAMAVLDRVRHLGFREAEAAVLTDCNLLRNHQLVNAIYSRLDFGGPIVVGESRLVCK
jgi:hypothetical protein